MSNKFIYLDIEASSDEMQQGTIVSIAAINPVDKKNFYTVIRHEHMTVKPKSMSVHGLSWEQLMKKENPTLEEADQQLADWLLQFGGERELIMTGNGVGPFDRPYVAFKMPKSSKVFHYRVYDFTSVYYFLAEHLDTTFDLIKDKVNLYGITKAKEQYPDLGEHNALFDCAANVVKHQFLMEKFNVESNFEG